MNFFTDLNSKTTVKYSYICDLSDCYISQNNSVGNKGINNPINLVNRNKGVPNKQGYMYTVQSIV